METKRTPEVICLGEILFDLLSDNPGLKLREVKSWTPFIGGAPANVAFALKKLGVSVAFVGRLGKDDGGKDLLDALISHHIETSGVQVDPKAPTRKVFVERSITGERKFAGFGDFHSSDFADTYLESTDLPYTLLLNSKYLVLGTLLLAYPKSRESLEKAIDYALRHNISLIMDVNWRPVFWEKDQDGIDQILLHIHKMDVLKFSKEEVELLYGHHDIQKTSLLLPKAKIILITDGDQGCHYKIGNHYGFVSAFKVKTVDTTGAGDSFLAGFIYQLLQIKDPDEINTQKAMEMVEFASAMGALTTLAGGAIAPQPSLDQVLTFLQNQP